MDFQVIPLAAERFERLYGLDDEALAARGAVAYTSDASPGYPCRVSLSEAIAFARERETFGKRLADHQVIRHKLMDLIRQVRAAYAYLDHCVWSFENGEIPVAERRVIDLCKAKGDTDSVKSYEAKAAALGLAR